jgi:hypothetical protein
VCSSLTHPLLVRMLENRLAPHLPPAAMRLGDTD